MWGASIPFPLAALAAAAAAPAGGGGGAAVAGALTGLSSAAGNLTSSFANLSGHINTVARLVSAVDPAIVAELSRSFRDLDAVIGTALRPVIVATIDVVRHFASGIFNAMISLAPVIEKMANSIAQALQPAFDVLGSVLEALVPVFDVVADGVSFVAKLFSDVVRTLRPFIEVVIELTRQFFSMIASLFGVESVGSGLKGMFESIRSALQEFLRGLILATATIAKFFGASRVLDAIIKGLQPKETRDARGAAVAQNASFKSIEELGRSTYLAAFQASAQPGGKGPQKVEDIMKDVLTEVRGIRDASDSELMKALGVVGDVYRVLSGIDQWLKAHVPDRDAVFSGAGAAAAAVGGPSGILAQSFIGVIAALGVE
jgi:hypothetical protein